MQGGVGAYTRILAEMLTANGQSVSIFSSSAAESVHPAIALERSVTHWNGRGLILARRWAARHRLDIVSLQYQTAAYQMSPWIHFLPDALRPLPLVTTFHDLRPPYWFPKAGPLRTWIVRRLAAASTGVIATNHEDFDVLRRHRLSELIPIGSNILSTVEHVDRVSVERTRLKLGCGTDSFLVAFFGLANRSKGLHMLIDALAILRSRGCPAVLVIVGGTAGTSDPSNTDYAKQIDRQIAQLDLHDQVRFTGYLDDASVHAHLMAADCIALPYEDGASFRRGSLMAALRCGMTIVTTTPRIQIPEFVDGENMVFTPPFDADTLAKNLWVLWLHPDLRARLQRGAAALSQAFDWETIARQHIGFFQRVLETAS